MVKQNGGGSFGQSLRYVDTAAPERTAPAGTDLLIERGLIARPAIGGTRKRGGFYPSIMSGVVSGGVVTGPLAAFAARKLMMDKTRKGGATKGEIRKRQRAEAKEILEAYGHPTVQNIAGLAKAMRMGNAPSQTFLEEFRARQEAKAAAEREKQEAKAAAKREKEEAKAAAKREKEASSSENRAPTQLELKRQAEANVKAAKAAFRRMRKESKKADKERAYTMAELRREAEANVRKAKRETKKVKKAIERAPTLLELRREAEANAAAARAALEEEAPKPEKRKMTSVASQQYFQNLRTARTELEKYGRPTGPNMSAYASMKRKGENVSAWLESFSTRRPKTEASAAAAPSRSTKPASAKPNKTEKKPKSAKRNATEKKPRTAKQIAYSTALSNAKTVLGKSAKAENRARWASLKVQGKNTSGLEQNVRARVGPKPLTAVEEANESNNE